MFITLGFLASAFGLILNIAIFLLVLSLVICIHELGHLYFAKRAGVLCHEFSFGMGPKIWSIKKGETRYSIRAIPFGGYVSMAGEEIESEIVNNGDKIALILDNNQNIAKIILNPEDQRFPEAVATVVEVFNLTDKENLHINNIKVNEKAKYVFAKNEMQIAPSDRRFDGKSKTNRFLITFGGPLMNFVLAIFIFLIIAFSVGVPNGSSSVIGDVTENSPAHEILEAGDKVISINGVSIDSWTGEENSISSELQYNVNGYILEVERDGQVLVLDKIHPLLVFYGLGFTAKSENPSLIISSPLYLNSELKSGDEILSINGQVMNNWSEVIDFQMTNLQGSQNREDLFEITIKREVTSESAGVVSEIKRITDEDGDYNRVTISSSDKDYVYKIPVSETLLVAEDDPILAGDLLVNAEHTYEYLVYGEKILNSLGHQSFTTMIGIGATTKFSFFGAIGNGFNLFWDAATQITGTLKLLFTSNIIGVSDLSGFVGIFSMTSQAASLGILSLLSFIGLLSVNLGILNLLPIPALDGGRIVFIGYEAITKRKPSQRFENLLHTTVFFLLLALMVYVTYNDILRLFGLK